MNINNRGIAAIYRIVAAFISLIGILSDFGVFNKEIRIWNILYFTTISNLLCFIMFAVLSVKTIRDIKKKGTLGSTSISGLIKGEITISIILTMSVYHFILIPYALKIDPTRRLTITDITLHYLIPCLTIFDWILFDYKGRFKISYPIVWTLVPYLYVLLVYVQAGFNISKKFHTGISKYVYIFLDSEILGIETVLNNIFKISLFFIMIGYFIYGIDRIRIQNNEKIVKKYRL